MTGLESDEITQEITKCRDICIKSGKNPNYWLLDSTFFVSAPGKAGNFLRIMEQDFLSYLTFSSMEFS